MAKRGSKIYISAAPEDLRTCRHRLQQTLESMGYAVAKPLESPQRARDPNYWLHKEIDQCGAVVNVAGMAYGVAQLKRNSDNTQCSTTQLELKIANDLEKGVFTFVCDQHYPYDTHEPEQEPRQRIQQEHRKRLLRTDSLIGVVSSYEDLEWFLRTLKPRLDQAMNNPSPVVSWIRRHTASFCLAALAFLFVQSMTSTGFFRGEVLEQPIKSPLEAHHRYVWAVTDAFCDQQAQIGQLGLTNLQLLDRAIAVVAESEGVNDADVRFAVDAVLASLKEKRDYDSLDQGLGKFLCLELTFGRYEHSVAADGTRDCHCQMVESAVAVAYRPMP
jgi:hypothetical protein